MAPGLAKRLLCNNKGSEEQRNRELDLALHQLRNHHQQYRDSMSVLDRNGVALTEAIEIAKTINNLADTLKGTRILDAEGLSEVSDSDPSDGHQQTSHFAPKRVSFYDNAILPQSPQKFSPDKTPRRSNCTTPDFTPSITNCESGFLATIGDEDSECTPQFQKHPSRSGSKNMTPKVRGKGKKKLSLNFNEPSGKEEDTKKVRILDGKNDITIWGPSMKELTLRTGSSSSSAENVPHRGDLQKRHLRKSESPMKNRSPSLPRLKQVQQHPSSTPQAKSRSLPLEQVVLGAMKNPSKTAKSATSLNDNILHTSSSISEFLPSDGLDRKKVKSVATDGDKGFEVFLEGASKQQEKRYGTSKLRDRADFTEKLQKQRREIQDIKQDLELCSMLLDQCHEGDAPMRNAGRHRSSLPPIGERVSRNSNSPRHRSIIRE